MESRSEDILFSILVPVRNTAKYLRQCIESILSQDYHNFEIVVVDNDSNDGSEILLDEYALKYPNITVIHQQNAGLLMSRRMAISEARGEYLCFVDSDDYIATNYLTIIYDSIKKNYADIVVFGANIVGEEGEDIGQRDNITLKERYSKDEMYQFALALAQNPILNNLWLKAVNKRVFDPLKNQEYSRLGEINGIEGAIQTLEILERADSMCTVVNEKIYYYRIRLSSTVRNINVEKKTYEFAYSNLKLNEYFSRFPNAVYLEYESLHFPIEVFSLFQIIRDIFQQKIPMLKKKKEIAIIGQNIWVYSVLDRIGVPRNKREVVLWCTKYKMYILVNMIINIIGR